MKIYKKQIYFCSHKLCYQVGGSKALRTNTTIVITKFLYGCILTKLGCPLTIVIDHGVHFINDPIKYLTNHFLLKHVSFTTYYL
jgi:hypothetical protein